MRFGPIFLPVPNPKHPSIITATNYMDSYFPTSRSPALVQHTGLPTLLLAGILSLRLLSDDVHHLVVHHLDSRARTGSAHSRLLLLRLELGLRLGVLDDVLGSLDRVVETGLLLDRLRLLLLRLLLIAVTAVRVGWGIERRVWLGLLILL